MSYLRAGKMVILDVRCITPEELRCLNEFLRLNMLQPAIVDVNMIVGATGGLPEGQYRACFSERQAELIEGWLKEKNIRLEQVST